MPEADRETSKFNAFLAKSIIGDTFIGSNILKTQNTLWEAIFSCALPMNNGSTMLFVIGLCDPGRSEGAKGREGRCTLPHSEFTVSAGDDLDLCTSWGESNNFIFQSIGESRVHSGTTREYDVSCEVLSDVNV